MNILTFILAFLSIFLTSLAQVSLRKAMMGFTAEGKNILEITFSIILNGWLILGLTLYFFSLCLWLAVLNKIEVSVAYPISSIGFLITAFIGYYFMGEEMNVIKLSGLFIICLGILIISKS